MFAFFLMLVVSRAQASPVTLDSLLGELTSNDARARWPEPAFKVRQASSYDRKRTAPDKPDWFANNDGSNYIRTEEHHGHRELVMMDADGPGAIVRFFFTNNGNLDNHIRVYLDGAEEPTLDWPSSDLLQDGLGVGRPLLSPHSAPFGHGGATLYLPIPYARHRKTTFEEKDPNQRGGRYYHIDYRTYSTGTAVETFSESVLNHARKKIADVNRCLAHPPTPIFHHAATVTSDLGPNQEAILNLPSGSQAIRQIEFALDAGHSPASREQELRSVVIQASFDGEQDAIWCPVGDFFGSGTGGRPVNSWYRDVEGHGRSMCRWTMPYHSHASLTLKNLGDQRVWIKLTAKTDPWAWDDRSMYFHCD